MPHAIDEQFTHRLREMMQRVGISSFKELTIKAGVAMRQVQRLRQGQAAEMQVVTLLKLSQFFKVSLIDLVRSFSSAPLDLPTLSSSGERGVGERDQDESDAKATKQAWTELRVEYDRLQTQLNQQAQTLQQEFQQTSLQTLESWLLQYPTAAYAAQQNPQAPAVKLLPLMRPVETLIKQWGVEAIAPVGTELPYDPQLHQLMDGTAEPGELVKIRYTGYRQGEKLLYRAKVSPIQR